MAGRPTLSALRSIVVKLGTSTCIKDGSTLDSPLLLELARQMAALMREGRHVVLVTSGAVGMGRRILGKNGNLTVPEKQALAALGQVELMDAYKTIFGLMEIRVAQVLLTREDIGSRERFLNARNALHTLLAHGVLPIVNENDSVATVEIRIGDNDNLAALVGSLVDAEMVINLTNTDGLWTDDPRTNPEAKRIALVERLKDLEARLGQVSELGTGGMQTKLEAARIATGYGAYMAIARSRDPDVISRLLQGEDLGTLFLPQRPRMDSRKRWIAFAGRDRGAVRVDDGAARAVASQGRSLLPAGIVQVEGEFQVGDVIRVERRDGSLLARGLANYSAEHMRQIRGLPSDQFERVLGFKAFEEAVHRNNLVVEK
ncbi:MAG: glutamate 5-kinase [Candidatus Xenobia bacterium]